MTKKKAKKQTNQEAAPEETPASVSQENNPDEVYASLKEIFAELKIKDPSGSKIQQTLAEMSSVFSKKKASGAKSSHKFWDTQPVPKNGIL